MTIIRMVVAEGHTLLRNSLKLALESTGKIKIIGAAGSSQDLSNLLKEQLPNIALIDTELPGENSIAWIPKLLRRYSEIKIIVMTSRPNPSLVTQLLKLGVHGCFTKDTTLENAIEAIEIVNLGQRYFNPSTTTEINFQNNSIYDKRYLKILSDLEIKIINLLIAGESYFAIAERLKMKSTMVNHYCYRIYEKLKIRSHMELFRFALKHRILNSKDLLER